MLALHSQNIRYLILTLYSQNIRYLHYFQNIKCLHYTLKILDNKTIKILDTYTTLKILNACNSILNIRYLHYTLKTLRVNACTTLSKY